MKLSSSTHDPSDEGMTIELDEKPWVNDGGGGGLDIRVEDIPKNVKVIRFTFWY